ncbi:hypothetical protein C8J57DRAFT_1495322 [Mycena rebaudengoi]|nr:hypothetical protein C8J57DRAFT_1495322 [Mycena rebaudengoi]
MGRVSQSTVVRSKHNWSTVQAQCSRSTQLVNQRCWKIIHTLGRTMVRNPVEAPVRYCLYPTTEASLTRRRADYPQDDTLDFGTPVSTMIWIGDDQEPVQLILYPREDLRVRLSDHKIALAQVGLEPTLHRYLARYIRDADGLGGWMDCRWDTPLRVYAPGDSLLICVDGITLLKHFWVHEAHMML